MKRQPVLVCRQWVALGRAPSPLPPSFPLRAQSVQGQKQKQNKTAADQPFSFFLHPLPPSSCYSWPVKGMNSTDSLSAVTWEDEKWHCPILGLTDRTASERSARASFIHTVTDFLAFKKYHNFLSAFITFKSFKSENGILACIISLSTLTHTHIFRDNRPRG